MRQESDSSIRPTLDMKRNLVPLPLPRYAAKQTAIDIDEVNSRHRGRRDLQKTIGRWIAGRSKILETRESQCA